MTIDLKYKEAYDLFIWNYRLDYDPVGVKFLDAETDTSTIKTTHKAKSRLSYCQFIAAARSARYELIMKPDDLSCRNAQIGMGYKKPEKDKDSKAHLKYTMNEDLSWDLVNIKSKLTDEAKSGIYFAPLDFYDNRNFAPDVVFFMATPYQSYHLLNEYMSATGKSHLNFKATANSAVCGGSIYSFQNQTANMMTMCAGSKTSGKTEMNYLNFFIPGSEILATAQSLKKRIKELGGPSLLGKGGESWPGLDVCGGCPLIKFEKNA